jgi:hypothetical protein
MAAGTIPPPGSGPGPCAEPCVHEDCKANRKDATSQCFLCVEPIGYDIRFFREEGGLVHESCYTDFVDLGRRLADGKGEPSPDEWWPAGLGLFRSGDPPLSKRCPSCRLQVVLTDVSCLGCGWRPQHSKALKGPPR